MKGRQVAVAFVLSLAAGVVFLFDALYATMNLVPCTSTGPAVPGPCNTSATVIGGVSGLGVALVVLGFLVFIVRAYPRLRLIWSALVISASVGGYALLLVVVILKSYTPALVAVSVLGLLFLPAVLLGVLGGIIGLGLSYPESISPVHTLPRS